MIFSCALVRAESDPLLSGFVLSENHPRSFLPRIVGGNPGCQLVVLNRTKFEPDAPPIPTDGWLNIRFNGEGWINVPLEAGVGRDRVRSRKLSPTAVQPTGVTQPRK